MHEREPRLIGRIAQNHERRGPRLALTFFMGALMGIGGFAMLGLTHQHPTIVDVVKPDESLCRAMLTQWLYGGEWVPRQELQQWQSFKRHMGDCVR